MIRFSFYRVTRQQFHRVSLFCRVQGENMTYEDFKNEVLGKGFDIDGAYGQQCFDGAMYYSQCLGYPVFHCPITGYVQDIWELRQTSGILEFYDEVELLEPGDIVVFKRSTYTPLSHIAIFDHDVDGIYGAFLGQNQGGAACPSGGSAFNIIDLPYSATYSTAFRPKCFAKIEDPEEPPKIVPGKSGSIYRLYNAANGDHLYTQSISEANSLLQIGWIYEGIGWIAPKEGDPVYRLYAEGRHIFTTNPAEQKNMILQGAVDEGIAFRSSGPIEIWRMYNPNTGDHVLTASRDEHDALSKAGWYCEGQKLSAMETP